MLGTVKQGDQLEHRILRTGKAKKKSRADKVRLGLT